MRLPMVIAEVVVTFIAPVGLINGDLVATGHTLHHFFHFRAPCDGLFGNQRIYHEEVKLCNADWLSTTIRTTELGIVQCSRLKARCNAMKNNYLCDL
jgi:hypothetical protein